MEQTLIGAKIITVYTDDQELTGITLELGDKWIDIDLCQGGIDRDGYYEESTLDVMVSDKRGS